MFLVAMPGAALGGGGNLLIYAGGMNTVFLLMARYDALPVIPLDVVCRDFFGHLTVEKLLRKVLVGEIDLPIVRIESSQKCAKGVHINDLAQYLDRRSELARTERDQLRPSAA
jgi:hypothetical protein